MVDKYKTTKIKDYDASKTFASTYFTVGQNVFYLDSLSKELRITIKFNDHDKVQTTPLSEIANLSIKLMVTDITNSTGVHYDTSLNNLDDALKFCIAARF